VTLGYVTVSTNHIKNKVYFPNLKYDEDIDVWVRVPMGDEIFGNQA
jgi:hypothetical protein